MSETNKEFENKSNKLEEDLEVFFASRQARSEAFQKEIIREQSNSSETIDPSLLGGGCCMTGCSDCPWGYASK